jgi:hypothetical protein
LVRQLERLDDLIVGPRHRDQILAGPAYGLMVQRGHLGPGAEQLARGAVLVEVHAVLGHLDPVRCVPAVAYLIREVLDERASQGHVEDVQATADGQERQPGVDDSPDE